jgi:hypothetical protein
MSDLSTNKKSMLAVRNLGLSLLGLTGAVSMIGLALLSGVVTLLTMESGLSNQQEVYNLVWIFGFFAVLLLPFMIITFYQLQDKPQPSWLRFPVLTPRILLISLAIWVFILGSSYWVGQIAPSFWLIMPPLKIFAVVLPLGLIISYLAEKFRPVQPSRTWGLISFSLVLTEPITILLEGIFIVFFMIGLAVTMDWSQVLGSEAYVYLNRLMVGMNNPDILSRLLTPFLTQPAILFILFVLFSLVVPVIEEIMKPMALWFLNKKEILPRDGFYYGALTGMVFALIESILGLTGFGADGWVSISIVRLGTGILHVFTSALMGWALTESWHAYRLGKLSLTFLFCVAVHGLWNFLAISISINDLIPMAVNPQQGVIRILFPAILVLMALGMLLGLLRVGRKLGHAHQN